MDAVSAVDRLVFPLDVSSMEEARSWVTRLRGEVGVFKVGLELYTAAGPAAVDMVHRAGAACFLDLKLHDISATMAKATAVAVGLGVRYLTVHTAAGPQALREVASVAKDSATTLLGVTMLTSLVDQDLAAIGMAGPSGKAVERLGRLAFESGLRGFVCSPHESAQLRVAFASAEQEVCLVVPGVRPEGSEAGDQRRIATPKKAIQNGADLLVVGRPIRLAADPVMVARVICKEMSEAIKEIKESMS